MRGSIWIACLAAVMVAAVVMRESRARERFCVFRSRPLASVAAGDPPRPSWTRRDYCVRQLKLSFDRGLAPPVPMCPWILPRE